MRTLRGATVPQKLSFVVSSYEAALWSPAPHYSPDADALAWSGQGAVLGPGLRLGATLFDEPEFGVFSTRGVPLFEVEPNGRIAFPSSPCRALPSQMDPEPLADFETLLRGATSTTGSAWEAELRPADPAVRAELFLSTRCLPTWADDPDVPDAGLGCRSDDDCASTEACVDGDCLRR